MASRDDASAATTTTDDGSQSADSKALKKKDDGSIDTADLKEKLAESAKESVAIDTRSTPDRPSNLSWNFVCIFSLNCC
ncbi:expressed unknown protein [Seminavis robusta]|uniref:Uncharacterized protein n=1 Tax=Seminavis robusta TaxID=568900 RepID=A0A9N8EVB6_9STRA|nr:expressed unknown protein [Seminavis robusta]|eukprot:Sro2103_g314700.1 n/a (79) ;mRNA; f:11833-12069